MRVIPSIIATMGLSLFVSADVNAAGKHTHGEASLFVVADSGTLSIGFEAPASDLLGFEHKPTTKQEEDVLEKVLNDIKRYQHLLTFADSRCEQIAVDVQQPFAHAHSDEHEREHKHHDEHEHHDHDEDHQAHEAHVDFILSYTLSCTNKADKDTLQLNAFKHFPSLKTIKASWVANHKQGSQSLTSADTSLVIPIQ